MVSWQPFACSPLPPTQEPGTAAYSAEAASAAKAGRRAPTEAPWLPWSSCLLYGADGPHIRRRADRTAKAKGPRLMDRGPL